MNSSSITVTGPSFENPQKIPLTASTKKKGGLIVIKLDTDLFNEDTNLNVQ